MHRDTKPTFDELFLLGQELNLWLTPNLGYDRMFQCIAKAVNKIDLNALPVSSYLVLEKAGLVAKVAAGVKECFGNLYEEKNVFCNQCSDRLVCKEASINRAIGNGVAVVALARRPRVRAAVPSSDENKKIFELVNGVVGEMQENILAVKLEAESKAHVTVQDFIIARFFLMLGDVKCPIFILRNPMIPRQVRIMLVKPSPRLVENYGLQRENVLRGWFWVGDAGDVSVLSRLVRDHTEEVKQRKMEQVENL